MGTKERGEGGTGGGWYRCPLLRKRANAEFGLGLEVRFVDGDGGRVGSWEVFFFVALLYQKARPVDGSVCLVHSESDEGSLGEG